jgi:hypothetical protein
MDNIYKYEKQENGDILLKKQNIDQNLYNIIKQGDNILLKKKRNIKINDIDDLCNYNFGSSEITKCIINDDEVNKLAYKAILEHVYNIINDPIKIIDNRKLNIKIGDQSGKKGFYYLDNLGISIQGADSNRCLLEILNQCTNNGIDIKLTIKLENGNNVNISL